MLLSTCKQIARILSGEYGLGLCLSAPPELGSSKIQLRPCGADLHEAVEVIIQFEWREVAVRVVPEKYAADLVHTIGLADQDARRLYLDVLASVAEEGGNVTLKVNGSKVPAADPSAWVREWRSFELVLRSPFIEAETDLAVSDQVVDLAVKWGGKLLGLVIPLLPTRQSLEREDLYLEQPELEGAPSKIRSMRYERSWRNRAACLAIHGLRCVVCGIDFAERYGRIGQGYIHVHHLIPVSNQEGERLVDPREDLVPVCPNCHAMIHRSSPPMTPDALREALRAQDQGAEGRPGTRGDGQEP